MANRLCLDPKTGRSRAKSPKTGAETHQKRRRNLGMRAETADLVPEMTKSVHTRDAVPVNGRILGESGRCATLTRMGRCRSGSAWWTGEGLHCGGGGWGSQANIDSVAAQLRECFPFFAHCAPGRLMAQELAVPVYLGTLTGCVGRF